MANLEFGTKALVIIVIGLIVALVTNGFFSRQVVVHVVPIDPVRGYEITSNAASEDYYRQMALSIIQLVANVTADSVDFSHEAFRRYLSPEIYGPTSEALTADARYIKQYRMARAFWPSQIEQQGERITLIGVERRSIGNKTVEEQRAYTLGLKIRDWRVQITEFSVENAAERQQHAMAAH